jgi:hypothetical protein
MQGVIVHKPAGAPGLSLRELERDDGDIPDRVREAILERAARRRGLVAVLGATYANTTMLPLTGPRGGVLGPAVDRHGRVLRWSVWAPVHRALIDIFSGRMPDRDELADRTAFADRHGLRYAIVEPGERLTLPRLKEWLNGVNRPA